MSDSVVEAFTQLAPRYEKTMDRELRFMWGLRYRDFIHRLVQGVEIREGDRVLDIATGTAVIPLSLDAETGVRVRTVGLDITPAMLQTGAHSIRQARTTSQIDLVCGSAMQVPLANHVSDVVICGLGMHHLDVDQALAEIRRVLMEGGRLVLAAAGVPALWRSWWGNLIVSGVIRTIYLLTHGGPRAQAEADALGHIYTREEWYDKLSSLGFAGIEIMEVPSRLRWGPTALFMKARLVSNPSQ